MRARRADASGDRAGPEPSARFEPDRLKATSDAVFAVALTLLILDIRPPEHASGSVAAHLRALAPQFGILALSFAIVAYYWVIHHLIFLYVRTVGRLVLWANLLFLLMITVLPFSAALRWRSSSRCPWPMR